jgi:hypothetical protein
MGIYRKYERQDVKEYMNYIPIRHGTRINQAGYHDIERMIYDRKNIEPEYRLEIVFIPQNPPFNLHETGRGHYIKCNMSFLLQNTGRRPLAISSCSLSMQEIHPKPSLNEEYLQNWKATDWMNVGITPVHRRNFPTYPVIIPYNGLEHIQMEFITEESFAIQPLLSPELKGGVKKKILDELSKAKKISFNVILKTVDGKHFTSDIFEVGV